MATRISKNIRNLALINAVLSTHAVWAGDRFVFDSMQQEKTFEATTLSLRCLVCQNQNLAESHAKFAESLKAIIYEKVKAGETESQIVEIMTEKYGDYIRYRPPFRFSTLLLWFGPAFFFVWLLFRMRIVKK